MRCGLLPGVSYLLWTEGGLACLEEADHSLSGLVVGSILWLTVTLLNGMHFLPSSILSIFFLHQLEAACSECCPQIVSSLASRPPNLPLEKGVDVFQIQDYAT